MSNISVGTKMPLTDLCLPKQWKTIQKTELRTSGYPVYGANGIIGYYNSYNHENETILIGCRGTCGQINVCQPKSYITGNAMCLDNLSDLVNMQYLVAFLESFDFRKIISGTSQPQITKQGLSKVLVPIRPLDEQLMIAAIFTQINTLIYKNQSSLKEIDILLKSQFVEMFDATGAVACKSTLGKYCTVENGYAFKSSEYIYGGIPIIRIGNIVDNEVILDKSVCATHSFIKDNQKYIVIKNDILMAMSGATTGKVGLYRHSEPAALNQRVARIRPKHVTVPIQFILTGLQMPWVTHTILGSTTGSAQPNLSKREILELPLPSASSELLCKFASFAEQADKSQFTPAPLAAPL